MDHGATDSAPRILVVDDEAFLADLIASALRYAGFDTAAVGSCLAAQSALAEHPADLVVLDVMLPDGSGIDLCRRLRSQGVTTPVIFLTARHESQDKIIGLTVGGDDYLTKPFSLDELVARACAVLRRSRPEGRSEHSIGYADLEIDEDAYEVRRAGVRIDLGPTEFKVLRYLAQNAGLVLSKQQILDHVWQYDFEGNDSVVATYISYLRRKIDCFEPPLIHTVPRVGYTLRVAASEVSSQ